MSAESEYEKTELVRGGGEERKGGAWKGEDDR